MHRADATTFEAVKSNAYAILASLGPHMRPAQLAQLFERLQVRAAASGVNEALSICGLLVGMAQRDAKVGPGWVSFACNAAQRAAGPSLVCTADTGLGAPPAGRGSLV